MRMRVTVPLLLLAVFLQARAEPFPPPPPPGGRLSPASPPSTPYIWKNVQIVAGGFVTGILFHPQERGLGYVRTDMGGAYRWEARASRWIPITDWVGPRQANLAGCESIALDPTDPRKVYLALGTYSRGAAAIARSADRGETFEVFPVPFHMGANEDGRGLGERLTVDPARPSTLFFGSRREGLWTSDDSGATWRKVETFPPAPAPPTSPATLPATSLPGTTMPRREGRRPGGGISFVLFDAQHAGTVFAGLADPGPHHVYRSTEGGRSWKAIPDDSPGAPAPGLLPHRAAVDSAGTLYITYGDGIGPNGVTTGAVYKLSGDTWTDITPGQPSPMLSMASQRPSGFGGVALDPRIPGTLMVSTIDRWSPGDEIFRSTDGGAHWLAVSGSAYRDASLSPYLEWGQPEPRFGWWLAALAIDPFDSDHAVYGTGATIWGTHDLTALDAHRPTHWQVAAEGIEETAVLALISPPEGPHLVSGVGDVGGFTHEDLEVSPAGGMHANPRFTNTHTLDFAQLKPSLIVRTGTPGGAGATREGTQRTAVSLDSGRTWRPLALPGEAAALGGGYFGASPLLVPSSDGSTILVPMAGGAAYTRDLGETWSPSTGLPGSGGRGGEALRPIADRALPRTFYALDAAQGRIYTSADGGETFAGRDCTGLPQQRGVRVSSSSASPGDLWALTGGVLYRSVDAGARFSRITSPKISVHAFALGKAAPDRRNLTLFIAGSVDSTPGLYRSVDDGASYIRINDDRHQFGGGGGSGYPTVIAGDPRVFGRVYLGMNGRGILYGDPGP